jgi:hypothetical protein
MATVASVRSAATFIVFVGSSLIASSLAAAAVAEVSAEAGDGLLIIVVSVALGPESDNAWVSLLTVVPQPVSTRDAAEVTMSEDVAPSSALSVGAWLAASKEGLVGDNSDGKVALLWWKRAAISRNSDMDGAACSDFSPSTGSSSSF